jgi:hypothetical protein
LDFSRAGERENSHRRVKNPIDIFVQLGAETLYVATRQVCKQFVRNCTNVLSLHGRLR